MLIATIMGGLIAGASGYGLVGMAWSAVIVGSVCAVAMQIVLVVEAHDRRRYRREVARWNRSHPSINPTQSRSVNA
jgi:Na+-driven multidrug efflux pump